MLRGGGPLYVEERKEDIARKTTGSHEKDDERTTIMMRITIKQSASLLFSAMTCGNTAFPSFFPGKKKQAAV